MMKKVLSICLLLSGLASLASAQTPMTLQPSIFLLERPDIQADLHLTGGQKSRLESLQQKLVHPPKRGTTNQNLVGTRAAMNSELAQANQQAESLLEEPQRTRLVEIKVQLLGDSVLLDPTVQKMLAITDEQKNQLASIQQQQAAKIRQRLRSGGLKGKDMVAAVKASQQASGAAMAKLLTPEQSEKLSQMKGKPFKSGLSS